MLFLIPIKWYCKRRVFSKCSTRNFPAPHPVWRASPLFSLSLSVTWSTCLPSLHLESSSLPLPLPVAIEKRKWQMEIPEAYTWMKSQMECFISLHELPYLVVLSWGLFSFRWIWQQLTAAEFLKAEKSL